MKHQLGIAFVISVLMALGCEPEDLPDGSQPCENGETRKGTTACGVNKSGFLRQKCKNGAWEDETRQPFYEPYAKALSDEELDGDSVRLHGLCSRCGSEPLRIFWESDLDC